MARSRKKTEATADDTAIIEATDTESMADTSFNPAEFDPAIQQTAQNIVQDVAEATKVPEQPANGFAARTQAHVANPSSKRRESYAAAVRKLPGSLMVMAGDLAVRLIDAGDNRRGIGIRVELPEGRTLTEEEKEIIRLHVKGQEGEKTGFSWDSDAKLWHKHIIRPGEDPASVQSSRPVAIRLDAESRVEKLAEALREHQADPVGFADRIRQQRAQAAEAGRIPD